MPSFLFYEWVRFNGSHPAVFLSSLCVRWARTPRCYSSVSQCFSPTSPKLASTPVSSSISNRYNSFSKKPQNNTLLNKQMFVLASKSYLQAVMHTLIYIWFRNMQVSVAFFCNILKKTWACYQTSVGRSEQMCWNGSMLQWKLTVPG